jgi:CheY-like chemotaxis protein
MALKGKEVLIVDDTPDLRFLARKIVENVGMIATEVASVDEALVSLASKAPHVILLDLKMLGKSGFSFLSLRAKDPALSSIPVVVMSSAADQETVSKAIALGANEYVVKPFSSAILIQKFRKILRDSDFKSFKFSETDGPDLKALVPARISRPTETGFFIECPIKLSVGLPVTLHCKALKKAGMDDCVYIAELSPGVRGASGFYFTRINIAGLSQSLTRAFKKSGVS